jgi:hypothetical protein
VLLLQPSAPAFEASLSPAEAARLSEVRELNKRSFDALKARLPAGL